MIDTLTTGVGLEPETAKTFNLGASFKPTFAKGLSVDLSYFYIDFKDEITPVYQLGYFANVLQQEGALGSLVQRGPSPAEIQSSLGYPGRTIYNGLAPGAEAFCVVGSAGCLTPNTSKIAAVANIGYVNASSVLEKGIDLTANHVGEPTRLGRFRADIDGTYLLSYQQQLTPGAPETSPLNTIYNPICAFGAKTNVGRDERGWGINARVNYTNAYDSTNAANPACPASSLVAEIWVLDHSGPKLCVHWPQRCLPDRPSRDFESASTSQICSIDRRRFWW